LFGLLFEWLLDSDPLPGVSPSPSPSSWTGGLTTSKFLSASLFLAVLPELDPLDALLFELVRLDVFFPELAPALFPAFAEPPEPAFAPPFPGDEPALDVVLCEPPPAETPEPPPWAGRAETTPGARSVTITGMSVETGARFAPATANATVAALRTAVIVAAILNVLLTFAPVRVGESKSLSQIAC
jgi:hypothetical protein